MSRKIVVGIDIGGSTTKIGGFDITSGRGELMAPLFVHATDPITSIYGAFGKFTDSNGLELSDIEKVMITGVGSSHVSRPLYSLPCETVPEFRCIGLGGLYLSGLDRAITVSMGTGTALVLSERGREPEPLGGTGVGGGTLIGLSKKLLDMDTVTHITELAEDGDLSRVDLRINDISSSPAGRLTETMTASNFGNISDLATKSDIALGIINLVFETIGMVSIFAARNHSIRDIVLTGNMTGVKQAKAIFSGLNSLFDMNFIIPEMSRFGTVIGAALSGIDSTYFE